MFSDVPVKYFGCTHRALKPSQTIEKVEKKLKKAGVTRVTEITHLDRIGIPVYSAIRPTAQEGAVSIYAGKGATPNQAKASAMMEAFERFSAEKQACDNQKISEKIAYELDNSIDPHSLILPKNCQTDGKLEWIEALDVAREEKYWVPANAVFHPYLSESSGALFKSNTNGLASGNIVEEAVFHGLTELIERDAWSIFEISRKQKIEIDCENTGNQIIQELLEKFKSAGVNIKIIDLTADIKVPTVAAVADDTILKDPALLTMGVGTHLDPEIAVIRALTEVAQSRATQIHGTREDTVRAVFMRKAGYERMKKINRHWFGDAEKIVDLENMKNRSSTSFKEDIETTINQVNKCGLDRILFVDLTRENIEVPVVRVIVPGLEVFSVDPDRIGERLTKIR